jgi:hypothetical protein
MSLYIIESGLIHALKPQAATITNLRISEGFRYTRHPPPSIIVDAIVECPPRSLNMDNPEYVLYVTQCSLPKKPHSIYRNLASELDRQHPHLWTAPRRMYNLDITRKSTVLE